MSLIDNLKWRYATKKMNGETVTDEKLNNILDAIQLAPSAYGLQPYTIFVISNPEVKAKLQPASYGQTQIVDGSHIIVFASWTDVSTQQVDDYIANIAAKRNMPAEALGGFKDYINGSIANLSQEQKAAWNSKQTYIALGIGLAAAAEQQVDATPMEGFVPAQYNEILGLNELGLNASVVMTLGYRSETDALATMPKVRRDKDLLFKFI
jgi:hypothetical protein